MSIGWRWISAGNRTRSPRLVAVILGPKNPTQQAADPGFPRGALYGLQVIDGRGPSNHLDEYLFPATDHASRRASLRAHEYFAFSAKTSVVSWVCQQPVDNLNQAGKIMTRGDQITDGHELSAEAPVGLVKLMHVVVCHGYHGDTKCHRIQEHHTAPGRVGIQNHVGKSKNTQIVVTP